MKLGTPLSPSATRVMLLGSGELGKEVIIALQRLGVEVIAVDRYDNAPGHQVAHRHPQHHAYRGLQGGDEDVVPVLGTEPGHPVQAPNDHPEQQMCQCAAQDHEARLDRILADGQMLCQRAGGLLKAVHTLPRRIASVLCF